MFSRTKFFTLCKPVGDGDGGGGNADRGDDYVPPDAEKVVADPEKAATDAAKLEKDVADQQAADEASKAKAKAKADADGEDDGEDDGKPRKDPRIPVSRHREILNRERAEKEALQQRLDQALQSQKRADTTEKLSQAEARLEALEAEHAKLITDGKVDEAIAKGREIRKLDREIIEQRAEEKTAAAVAQSIETTRFDITLERIEAAYPKLNPDGEDFDEALSKRVLKLHRSNMADGMKPAAALQDAVKFVMGEPETGRQRAAVEVTARVDTDKAKTTAETRAKDEREKTAEALTKAAPSMKESGQDSDKAGGGALDAKQVMKLPPKEFEKLSEADLARVRGDVL